MDSFGVLTEYIILNNWTQFQAFIIFWVYEKCQNIFQVNNFYYEIYKKKCLNNNKLIFLIHIDLKRKGTTYICLLKKVNNFYYKVSIY